MSRVMRAATGAAPTTALATVRVVAAVTVAAVTIAVMAAVLPSGCTPPPVPREYRLEMRGSDADLPWNRTLYISHERGDGTLGPPTGVFFDPESSKTAIVGSPGTKWLMLSEANPSVAMRRLLWMVVKQGVFGEDTTVTIDIPPRTGVAVVSGDDGTDDLLTFADPESGARLVASRSEQVGLRWAIWNARRNAATAPDDAVQKSAAAAEDWRGHKDSAPARPWVWRESKAGTLDIAAHTADRQWLVQRLHLKPGETTVIDLSAQPRGGAKVICEDVRAELLIRGELVLPPMRLSDLQFRATWTNVPPGSHVLRYADGRTAPFECKDADDLTFPK